jgi:hypothetical protein
MTIDIKKGAKHMFELPSNPGSYNEFLESNNLQHSPEALQMLSEAMDKYRQDLIAIRGLEGPEELHVAPLDFIRPERAVPIGSIALAG